MRRIFQGLLQSLLLVALLATGVWVRSLHLNDALPVPSEAPHLLAAAAEAETVATTYLPTGAVAQSSPFHLLAAPCARFLGAGKEPLRLRCYRLFPIVAAVLFLPLLAGLGLRRRGGLFEETSGLWVAFGVAVFVPGLVIPAWTFEPTSFLALVCLAIVVSARSYAQWPGLVPTVLWGALWAVAVAVEPSMVWVLALFLPAILLGVGWTRLCLYWRWFHVAVALGVGGGLWALLYQLGCTLPLRLCRFAPGLDWWELGGLAASVALIGWGFRRGDRRWARCIGLILIGVWVASTLAHETPAFRTMVAVLAPVAIGMACATIPPAWGRWVMGNGVALGASAALGVALVRAQGATPPRHEQKSAGVQIVAAGQALRSPTPHLCVVGATAEQAGVLLWPLRRKVTRLSLALSPQVPKADLVLVREDWADGLLLARGARVLPGAITLAGAADVPRAVKSFRVLEMEAE